MLVLYKKYGEVLMDIHFNRLTAKYKKETIDIFNYYIHITDILVRTETKWRNGAKAKQRT